VVFVPIFKLFQGGKQIMLNEPELQKLCNEWKKRLGLAHWRIDIRYGRRDEFDDNVIANVTHQIEFENAVIKILDPSQYIGLFPQDIEQSIVHELLHILFAPIEPEGGYYGEQKVLAEQIADRIARVLVSLKRERIERGFGFVENPAEGKCVGTFSAVPEVTI
jgi:hypothetical protein